MSDLRVQIRQLKQGIEQRDKLNEALFNDNKALVDQINMARALLVREFLGRLKWAFLRK